MLLAYLIGGAAVFIVMRALGEMAVRNPVSGSFGSYARQYLGPLAGFITGWTYTFEMVIVALADVTAFGLGWEETTWNFACSTTETSTWADGGRKFGELMEKATGGKVKVNIYAADQLTNGNQSEGIQALMNGDPVQISMHSNLIYSAFDPRFNVVSLPFIYDSYDDADAKFDGAAGEKLKELLSEYGLPRNVE